MKIIGFIVYIVLQILFIPFAIIGLFIGIYTEMYRSKKQNLSFSAVQALQYRWIMHMFDTRKDPNTISFTKKFPCESHLSLWLVMGPFIIVHKLLRFSSTFNTLVPYGSETLQKIAGNRVLIFDDIMKKYIDTVDQVVLLGAGFDLICNTYTKDKDITVFELDQVNTLTVKKETLIKANIPHNWIHYVPVDYEKESWSEKLLEAGFERTKKTLFLWQSVSLYLGEEQVIDSLKKMRELSSEGSVIAQDFYAQAFLDGTISKIAIKNMNMIAKQGEPWKFAVDMSMGAKKSINHFLQPIGLEINTLYNFGENTNQKDYYCIIESII